jgi:hypothetical protein
MKAIAARVRVTDHAVLRFLEREHGIDVEAVRRALAMSATPAAMLGAHALGLGRVKIVLINGARLADGTRLVEATTCLNRAMTPVRDNGHRGDAA